MNNEDLLARIKILEQENSVLQKTIDELQQEEQSRYPLYATPVIYHGNTMELIANEFWGHPADNFWNQPKRKPNRRDPRYSYLEGLFPGMVTGDEHSFGYGTIAAEDSPENEEENAELRQKVGELKKKIEKLEKKLKNLNSPLTYVVEAIKDKARYDSPSAAYELFEKQDYIFRNCEQWQDNVKELRDFLLREKHKALQPSLPYVVCPTDEQMADAISSICGEGKALDDKQKWLGVCCMVRAKYDYPFDIEACCNRLAALPYKTPLYKVCDYENVRKLAVYGFASEPYDRWRTYVPRNSEKKHFDSCFYVARELEIAIDKIVNSD